ncbi:MAG: formate dehydrogenase accessory sulfurtransferase FdhD [Lachnospiraceae bacterium]|nr:formate dehydrogenase accessory sulfurtransferase FdhD [Lachnospiraceae bacterium]
MRSDIDCGGEDLVDGSKENLVEVMEAMKVSPTGETEIKKNTLIREYRLLVKVNGSSKFQITCTKDCLKELVVGRLFLNGWIEKFDDISEMKFSEMDREVCVNVPECEPVVSREFQNVPEFEFQDGWIFKLIKEFSKGMPLHDETRGTHSCILAKEDEILFSCEDIGRHNAVDKAIGYALINGIDFHKCLIFTSGRVPVDMVEKAIIAGVPVIVSKAVPTYEAVELAKKYRVTIVSRAYSEGYEVYKIV